MRGARNPAATRSTTAMAGQNQRGRGEAAGNNPATRLGPSQPSRPARHAGSVKSPASAAMAAAATPDHQTQVATIGSTLMRRPSPAAATAASHAPRQSRANTNKAARTAARIPDATSTAKFRLSASWDSMAIGSPGCPLPNPIPRPRGGPGQAGSAVIQAGNHFSLPRKCSEVRQRVPSGERRRLSPSNPSSQSSAFRMSGSSDKNFSRSVASGNTVSMLSFIRSSHSMLVFTIGPKRTSITRPRGASGPGLASVSFAASISDRFFELLRKNNLSLMDADGRKSSLVNPVNGYA